VTVTNDTTDRAVLIRLFGVMHFFTKDRTGRRQLADVPQGLPFASRKKKSHSDTQWTEEAFPRRDTVPARRPADQYGTCRVGFRLNG
jgi:hypothetical protein